jgi:Cu+-exporting ATPase
MNVLVALGATSAFIYSLVGSLLDLGPDYLFYETAATIITRSLLGALGLGGRTTRRKKTGWF